MENALITRKQNTYCSLTVQITLFNLLLHVGREGGAGIEINQLIAAHVPIRQEYCYLIWIYTAESPCIIKTDSTWGGLLSVYGNPFLMHIWSCSLTCASIFLLMASNILYFYHLIVGLTESSLS